ncbi:MAG: hypothetical protein QGF34_06610 [Candidatus Poseidoniaceae archaeon]|nr:hypothetical protein [Candidatus Poseidoniaceae archaeon]
MMSNKGMTGGLLVVGGWARYMTPEELLAITPELLGKAILHRRERLAAEIPEQLDARSGELTEAASMARAAKSKRDDVNKKVASLKKERNDAQAKAKALFMEASAIQESTPHQKGDSEPEPEWAKERLQQRLDALDLSLQTNWGTHVDERATLNEMKNLIRQHEEWVDSRKDKFSEINRMKELREDAKKLLETADKAHQAMVQLHDENQIFHDTYLENEKKRRHADARTTRLAQALDQSQRGIDFWKHCLEHGFYELLTDAERVREGGKSTRALARERYQKTDKAGGDE